MEFAPEVLQMELAVRGLSAQDFAERAGLHPQTVWKACKGERVSRLTAVEIYQGLERHPPLANLERLLK